jgi:hypothetical protein
MDTAQPHPIPGSAGDVELELFARVDERAAWRLRHRNGQTIATDGSQGYEDEADARRIGERIAAGYRMGAIEPDELALLVRRALDDLAPADREDVAMAASRVAVELLVFMGR